MCATQIGVTTGSVCLWVIGMLKPSQAVIQEFMATKRTGEGIAPHLSKHTILLLKITDVLCMYGVVYVDGYYVDAILGILQRTRLVHQCYSHCMLTLQGVKYTLFLIQIIVNMLHWLKDLPMKLETGLPSLTLQLIQQHSGIHCTNEDICLNISLVSNLT